MIFRDRDSHQPDSDHHCITPKVPVKKLIATALSSEDTYFGLAAHKEIQEGYRFSYVPGLETLPGACVCLLETANVSPGKLSDRVEELEEKFVSLGATQARFYGDEVHSSFFSLMEEKGYRRRSEIIHAFPTADCGQVAEDEVKWRPVLSEQDWAAKETIHALASLGSDGYEAAPSQWVSLERRKSAAGHIEFWLYYEDGQPVVTTGVMRCPENIVRAKNFFVRADCRGRGLGSSALGNLIHLFCTTGEKAMILLSVEGSAGQRLYQSVGAKEIGRIYEWSRPLSP